MRVTIFCLLSASLLCNRANAFGDALIPLRITATSDSIFYSESHALNGSPVVDSIVAFACRYIGTPYKYGSESGNTFDCSGYLRFVFRHFGIDLPRSSALMAALGIQVNLGEVSVGDLLFFKGRNISSESIGHVSLVIGSGDEGVRMIHATRRGVVIENLQESSYYLPRYLLARRIYF
jgi:cell wall-associated NlpC family hydrolase